MTDPYQISKKELDEKCREFVKDEDLIAGLDKKVFCPTCSQLVHRYRRPLTSSQVKALINLYRLDLKEPGYHHLDELQKGISRNGSNDVSKMRFYGLTVQRDQTEEEKASGKKRTSGMWAITEKGRAFVRNQLTVPKYIWIYDNHVLGFDGESVTIGQLFKNFFNYRELMGEDFFEPAKEPQERLF